MKQSRPRFRQRGFFGTRPAMLLGSLCLIGLLAVSCGPGPRVQPKAWLKSAYDYVLPPVPSPMATQPRAPLTPGLTVVPAPRLTPVSDAGPVEARVIVASANLRAGPGTSYAVVGQVTEGQSLRIAARDEPGKWFQLNDGHWIAGFLIEPVLNVPLSPSLAASAAMDTPTVTATATPSPTVTATLRPTATPTHTPTATATATPSPTVTATLTPTATLTATATPSPTVTATLTPTATTPRRTPTLTATATTRARL